jgi:polysaccharide biosynthesis/export protein
MAAKIIKHGCTFFFSECMKLILFIPIFIVFAGCSASRQSGYKNGEVIQPGGNISINPESDLYIIRIKDQVKITILEYPEFDTTTIVRETGMIYIRYVGEIPAQGLTKAQLTKDLISKFSAYTKNKASVVLAIVNKELQNVTVLGYVTRQGAYPPISDGSLLETIASAGGPTTDSDLRHVKIFRRGDYVHPIEVDLTLTLNANEASESRLPTVGPGDTVYIPKEEDFVHELSLSLSNSFFLFSLFTFLK